MAFSTAFQQDKLFKHTQDVNQTSIGKAFYEESWQTRHQVHSSEVWSSVIDPDPAVAVAAGIAQELNYIQLTPDPSVPGNRTWVFCSTPGDLNTRIQGLIPPIKFGANYTTQLRDNNGVAIQQTWDWICDYAAGTVVFENAPAYPTPYFGKSWRYTGATGGGEATSIKNTITVSKLGSELSTGLAGIRILKIYYPFLMNDSFVRVYEDDILIPYTTRWTFNVDPQSKIGNVSDLTDGVVINGIIPASTYRIEVDEWHLPVIPTLMLWRNDNANVTKSNIFYRSYPGGGSMKLLESIEDVGNYTYQTNYTGGWGCQKKYADRLGVAFWKKGQSLPANWRIELYKLGKKKTGILVCTNPLSHTINNTLCPHYVGTPTVNAINIYLILITPKRYGLFLVRLRNITTNTVTNFSSQKLRIRNYGIRNNDFSLQIGRYVKSGLI